MNNIFRHEKAYQVLVSDFFWGVFAGKWKEGKGRGLSMMYAGPILLILDIINNRIAIVWAEEIYYSNESFKYELKRKSFNSV